MISSEILSRRLSIKVPKALPRALDSLDVKKLLSVIPRVRDRAMILVLLRTGIRIGELLNLRVSDVYLPERKIHLVVGEKNRTGRVVYLSGDACQALQEWIRKRDAGKPLLIYGQGRSSLSYTAARAMFQKYLKKAGISEKGYSLHGLRHTCVTELLNAGMRIECLQQVLGHSNLEQTRRYARLTDKTREEEYFRAMARIEGRENLMNNESLVKYRRFLKRRNYSMYTIKTYMNTLEHFLNWLPQPWRGAFRPSRGGDRESDEWPVLLQ
jgi:site-specific recombinase XerD